VGPNGQSMASYLQTGVGTNWIYWKDARWVLGGTRDAAIYAYSGAVNGDGDGAPLPANAWTTILSGYDPAPTVKPGLGGLALGDEDVTYWLSHRYLEISCQPQTGPLPVGTILSIPITVKYKTASVYDNHQDSTIDALQRQVSVSLGAEQEISYTGRAAAGTIWVDLWTTARPDLQHVSSIEITLPDGYGNWVLSDTHLREHNSNDPVHVAPSTHTYLTMHEVLRAYASGGARSQVDGICIGSLCSAANFNVFSGHERLLEMIWWFTYITEKNTVDQSAMWSLANYLQMASYCVEGWDAALPGNWDARTIDADDKILTQGYSCDVMECQHHNVDSGVAIGGLKCYQWATAAGILYKPHGVLVVEGGIHGLANRRDACCVKVYRRERGTSDVWENISSPATDGHGYWYFPAASDSGGVGEPIVRYDTDEKPVYYEYLVSGSNNTWQPWGPSGQYSEGRIGLFEGVTCTGDGYEFAVRFWEAKYGAVFPSGWGAMSLADKQTHMPTGAEYIAGAADLEPGDIAVDTYGGAIIYDENWLAYTDKTGQELGWFGPTTGVSGVFRIDLSDATASVIPQIFERQHEWAYAVLAGLEEVDMVTDAFDIEHAAATSGAALYALEKSSGADVWDDAVEISSASVAGYSSPGITAVASGRLVVAAIDADDGELKTWYSDDRGKTWVYEGSKVI